ncbi:MAG: pyridine nucleotide-disulfide oxidoreductase [Thermoplasmata archaeon]|nr:MAG: pyridine nucleotide-disulfide oxidoreductase [Thermoplasmata archaeon]
MEERKVRKYDVVIIGGGPGGVTTALSARNTYPEKSILLIRREKTPLIPCGVPYVFHTLDVVEDDILPDKPLEKNGVELLVDEVAKVQDNKELILRSGERIKWDKLVLALGSKPFVPPLPGIDKKGVYFVKKEIDYLKELREEVEAARNIVILGGGFIGVEVADELLKKGKTVVLIEKLSSLLPLSMDAEFGIIVAEILKERGAEVVVGTSVKEIIGEENVCGVKLENGKQYPADVVIIAAGYRPNIELAQQMGLEVDPRYGIIVDEYMRTSMKDVFAVGDCVAKRNFLTGEFSKLMLASTATAQGRLVGSNLFDLKVIKEFIGTIGTFSTKIGDTAFGATGLTETQAKSMGIDYLTGVTEVLDRHPGKLPGASKIYIKLIYARYSHVLLGAQLKGGDSVGEWINMLTVMVQNKMTAMEIDTLQIGTHPLLTSSPIAYPVINATVDAIMKWYNKSG